METASSHWVNNFWGKEDAGYNRLMQRVQESKQTCDELKHYYKERMAIEHDYARKLNALAHKALGSAETGGMKMSLETVRSTTKATAATHETVARQINEQLLGPLVAFSNSLRNRNKSIEDLMHQLTRAKNSQNSNTEKARSRYLAECNKISGFQAQQNLLMGKELDKNNQKLDKATYQVEGFQRQYQDGLKALAQSIEVWNAEWRISCDKLEQIEEERLGFTKSNLWAFANAISAACVADDEGCETVRTSLEKCDPAQDLQKFCKENGTGSQIQDPPEFVNFLQGFSRDSNGDEGRYHMANFGSSVGGDVPQDSDPLSPSNVPDLHLSSESTTSVSPPLSDQYTPMSSPGATSLDFTEIHSKPDLGPKWQQNASVSSFSVTPAAVYERNEPSHAVHQVSQQQQPQQQQQKQIQLEKKKQNRRSWAMPFKRKSNPEFIFKPVSALDQPTPSSSFTRLPVESPTSLQPDLAARRQSWAPASLQASEASGSRTGIGISGNEDPLLAALEKLKAPAAKVARPQSMVYAETETANRAAHTPGNAGNTPYGNGSPSFGIATSESARRSPVHRKQVGSASPTRAPAPQSLPTMTSDRRPVIKHSRAQYDYRAAIPEEVTFKKGDLLLVTEMQDDGWWDCEVAGRHSFGLAPSNFLADA